MLRALWFFFQLSIVVCAAIWLIAQKGSVDLVWNDYSLSLDLGLFLLFLALFTFVAIVLFKMIGAIVDMPMTMSRHRKEKNRIKGFQALTRGFVAIAAGDIKKANGYAKDARYLLPNETGLSLLLDAQAARMSGDMTAAQKSFEALLHDKDAAFLGIRGLVKSALDQGNMPAALSYAKTALEQHPKQPWILKSVYDLELQSGLYEDAYRRLQKLTRHKVMDDDIIKKDEVALLMILAEKDAAAGDQGGWLNKTDRVIKLNSGFVPAVMALSNYYISKGKENKISSLIERAWKINPHPDLAVMWGKIAPMPKSSDPFRRLRWFEKLVTLRPDDFEGQYAAAKVAMESGLNGEARQYLLAAEKIRPSAKVYRMFADLEEKTTHNPSLVRSWLEKASNAAPDPVWYCTQTGHIYESWSGIAMPHGAFNTIEWGHPLNQNFVHAKLDLKNWDDPMMIEQN